MSFFNWIKPREREKLYLTFNQRAIKWVLIWVISVFSLWFLTGYIGNLQAKIYTMNVPVYEQVFNSQCDLSLLKEGQKVSYDGKFKTVKRIYVWSFGDTEITLED